LIDIYPWDSEIEIPPYKLSLEHLCDRTGSFLGFCRVNVIFVLGFKCWTAVNFLHACRWQSLSRGGKFVVCVLCETGWQLTMGDQAQFMQARKTGRRGDWTKIRDWIWRRKKVCCLVEWSAIFNYKRELAAIDSCYVFLRYTNNYMMTDSVFWLEIRLIKGWCWMLMTPKGWKSYLEIQWVVHTLGWDPEISLWVSFGLDRM
jgi:hypothetical protein